MEEKTCDCCYRPPPATPFATASATCTRTGTSTATATSSADTLENAKLNARKLAETAALYSLTPLTRPGAGDVNVSLQFCLGCLDFRFISDLSHYQNIKGLCNNYDYTTAPGASLAYNGKFTSTGSIYTDCIDDMILKARELHQITELVIVEHMDCGAYGLVYPELVARGYEYELHVENMNQAAETLLCKFSFFKSVVKYLIQTDGTFVIIE